MSYQLLLDLLYENKKYDEIIKTFEVIKERQIQGTKYPRNIVVLTMAALYKQVIIFKLFFVIYYTILSFCRIRKKV